MCGSFCEELEYRCARLLTSTTTTSSTLPSPISTSLRCEQRTSASRTLRALREEIPINHIEYARLNLPPGLNGSCRLMQPFIAAVLLQGYVLKI